MSPNRTVSKPPRALPITQNSPAPSRDFPPSHTWVLCTPPSRKKCFSFLSLFVCFFIAVTTRTLRGICVRCRDVEHYATPRRNSSAKLSLGVITRDVLLLFFLYVREREGGVPNYAYGTCAGVIQKRREQINETKTRNAYWR